jgi:hypothetical protein
MVRSGTIKLYYGNASFASRRRRHGLGPHLRPAGERCRGVLGLQREWAARKWRFDEPGRAERGYGAWARSET